MARINAVINDDLEKLVRAKAVSEFGGRRGSFTKVLEAALRKYVEA